MRVSAQIRDYLRRLHPDQRRAIKAALRGLDSGVASDSQALSDDLEGFYRLRVGKFRIVYRFRGNGQISCEFIDVRSTVYERFSTMRELIEATRLLKEPAATYEARVSRTKTKSRTKSKRRVRKNLSTRPAV
jgi:mRNA interferase RelE/StbE